MPATTMTIWTKRERTLAQRRKKYIFIDLIVSFLRYHKTP